MRLCYSWPASKPIMPLINISTLILVDIYPTLALAFYFITDYRLSFIFITLMGFIYCLEMPRAVAARSFAACQPPAVDAF